MSYPEVKIGEITNPINGKTFKSSEWRTSGLPIIRIQNLKDPDAKFNYYPGQLEDQYRVKTGELLFAWSGTPGTSFGAFIWNGPEGALNQHIFRLPIDEQQYDKMYLRYALNYRVTQFIEQAQGGVGLAHITKSKFVNSTIPLPKIDEQRKVAQTIETLFSEIDAGLEDLNQAKANLDLYKQSVLNSAVQGKLVPQNPKDEPASKLLERIRSEKEKLVKAGKIRKEKPLAPITKDELPFELPNGWAWVRLRDLFSISSGDMLSASKMVTGQFPVYGGNGINGSHNEWNTEAGILTIGRVGAKCGAIHTTQSRSWVTDNAFVVSIENALIQQNYLTLLLTAIDLNKVAHGGAQPVISGAKIYPFITAIPPKNEQQRIFEYASNALESASNKSVGIDAAIEQIMILRQSILKSAFEGTLV